MKLQKTIFHSPVVNPVCRIIARLLLLCLRWRREGDLPNEPRYVLIAAPHTSNWDLFYTLLLAFDLNAKIYWMGKQAIFKKPFGGLMKWLGGIPIDRSKTNNVVDQAIEQFHQSDELVITVPPSGTRSQVAYWKTGFYYIAHGAGIPIALGFLDYGRKVGGIGPLVIPSGDYANDMDRIISFYSGITGKHPKKMSDMKIDIPEKRAA